MPVRGHQKARLLGGHHRLGAVGNPERLQNRCHMQFHRPLGQAQITGDFLVRLSYGKAGQHIRLPAGQNDTGRVIPRATDQRPLAGASSATWPVAHRFHPTEPVSGHQA